MDHVLAIDQGTSATKCILVDAGGRIVAKAGAPLGERYPQVGWVEQDAEEIWSSVRSAVAQCLAQREGVRVAAVGLSTQRESALIRSASHDRGTLLASVITALTYRFRR